KQVQHNLLHPATQEHPLAPTLTTLTLHTTHPMAPHHHLLHQWRRQAGQQAMDCLHLLRPLLQRLHHLLHTQPLQKLLRPNLLLHHLAP
ncbi:hypothetical protein CPC16_005426, partial [Podila verticillata]